MPSWHISIVPGATEVAVRAVLVRSGSLGAAVQRRPRKYSEVTGALVAGPRGHVTEGAVPDATGITPSGVCDEGRQGCRREVSAQAGDEHPSASSEPNGQLETEEGISSLALHGCTQVWSVVALVPVRPNSSTTTKTQISRSVMARVKDTVGTARNVVWKTLSKRNADVLACSSWHTEGNIFGNALFGQS